MKILQLIHTQQLRGAETFAAQLTNHLADRNHEIILVALYNGNGKLPTDIPILNLKASKALDIAAMRKFASLVKNESVQIIQANAGDTLKFAVLAKLLFRFKAKIVFRNASTMSRYLQSSKQKFFYRFLLKHVAHVISVSETSKKDILKSFPQLDKKTTVIPVGVEDHAQTSEEKEKVLLHVGGFSFEKNHRGLLNIFRNLLADEPDLKLWLVGDGPMKNEIVELAQQLGIAEHVIFWGSRNDVAHFMQRASVFVLPSILEGLPAVILEAMQAQLPVVAYDAGGIHELVRDNETGWLIPVNNENAFTAAVREALRDVKKRNDIIKQATLLVNKEYRNEIAAARFENIYTRVLADDKNVLLPV